MITTNLGRRVRRAVLTILSLALASVAFAMPADAAGSGRLAHLTGSVVGHAGPQVRDDACPVKIVGFQHGMRDVFTGAVVHDDSRTHDLDRTASSVRRHHRTETVTASVCVICCGPGGESLVGTFTIETRGGTLTGDAQGSACSCAIPITFQLTLTVTHGTRRFTHHNGQVLMLQGSFEGGSVFDGTFASNTTLTTSP